MFAVRLLCVLGLISSLSAEVDPPEGQWMPYALRSGAHDNASAAPAVVYQGVVALAPSVPWVRVHFAAAQLPSGSLLRLRSFRDGEVQELDAQRLREWGQGSAFFNGHAVIVELVAGAGARGAAFEIEQVWCGRTEPVAPPERLCTPSDTRVPSADPAVGRLLYSGLTTGCTAFLAETAASNGASRPFVTSGSCGSSAHVVQFNVPASNADCSLVHPPVADQYAVDTASVVGANNGIGDSYSVFLCFPNATSGLTPYQAQGAALRLAPALPTVVGTVVRLIGFAVDGNDVNSVADPCNCAGIYGARNRVQQSDLGPFQGAVGNEVSHRVSSCSGTGGAPILVDATSEVIGVHTHTSCQITGAGRGIATSTLHPSLRQLVETLSRTTPGNDECAGAVTLPEGISGPYTNLGATLSSPSWTCGSATGADVWFRFVAPCSGGAIVNTCANTDFDTVVEYFRGGCGAPWVRAGCSDDFCGTGSVLGMVVTRGEECLVRVGGKNGAVGRFQLELTCRPLNDACTEAFELREGWNGPYDNRGALHHAPPLAQQPCPYFLMFDTWFRYTARCDADLTFETCGGTTVDTLLHVYRGDCANLIPLTCGVDECGRQSRATLRAEGGVTYYLMVAVQPSAQPGDFQILVTEGRGTFTTEAGGCGGLALQTTGSPNLGGTVRCELQSAPSAPFLWVGLPIALPLCAPCTLRATPEVVIGASVLQATIPCDASLLGGQLSVQGADFAAAAGCPPGVLSPLPVAFSDGVRITIG
ncbi:MAG: hypothetical protein JNM84_20990 [Planctomycetes bacterium]|nr:hypothetical protein [Planctomycetota bacterium]